MSILIISARLGQSLHALILMRQAQVLTHQPSHKPESVMLGMMYLRHGPLLQEPHQSKKPGDHPFFLHEAPDTIQDLYNTFLNEGLVDGPRLSESIHVRSWYLHHVHHRIWHTPRILELDGHWSHWARDIAEGWRDQVREDEDLVFFTCHPDPPRVMGDYEIYFDLILVQGTDFPARAGLITVIRADDTAAARADYALCCVPCQGFVSGQHIAALANQVQQCHLRYEVAIFDRVVMCCLLHSTLSMT